MSIPEDVRTVEVNGVSLAYRETGRGEPVVFVHGDLSDLRTWDAQLPVFGASYRAIAYSRRYARPNADILPGTLNPMGPHIGDLLAFLDRVGAAPAHLVANSWGAFVSLLAAVRRPDAVRSLVLEEPPVVPLYLSDPPSAAELKLLAGRPAVLKDLLRFQLGTVLPAGRAFRAGRDGKALRTFLRGVLDRKAFGSLKRERVPQMWENLSALKAGLFGAGFPVVDTEAVRRLRTPTLLVTGLHSAPVLHRLVDRLEELLPDTERVEIVRGSHLMHEEDPAALNGAVLDFVARH
ncbi:alpha/beta fold hydrolase [Streptomyces yaizuensis]|uniref:Alpha/beta hydrolase n=1 Tax=Streptomyces yaizuensis TaxID=2989713 RepID=A0ABQ5P026_9ACTN|nr:alpha/beta hydrolase [Streptomyces sp. YSPA8]GLF95857.1 alpha/beta hydrolase [Streptomyces sp. YSPA8]